jgi:hypothetical protein
MPPASSLSCAANCDSPGVVVDAIRDLAGCDHHWVDR